MLTEKELKILKREERRYVRAPSTLEDLELASLRYQHAHRRWSTVYDQMESVRGLDEFDPKHMAWETRLFRAENKKDLHKEIVLLVARSLECAEKRRNRRKKP